MNAYLEISEVHSISLIPSEVSVHDSMKEPFSRLLLPQREKRAIYYHLDPLVSWKHLLESHRPDGVGADEDQSRDGIVQSPLNLRQAAGVMHRRNVAHLAMGGNTTIHNPSCWGRVSRSTRGIAQPLWNAQQQAICYGWEHSHSPSCLGRVRSILLVT